MLWIDITYKILQKSKTWYSKFNLKNIFMINVNSPHQQKQHVYFLVNWTLSGVFIKKNSQNFVTCQTSFVPCEWGQKWMLLFYILYRLNVFVIQNGVNEENTTLWPINGADDHKKFFFLCQLYVMVKNSVFSRTTLFFMKK